MKTINRYSIRRPCRIGRTFWALEKPALALAGLLAPALVWESLSLSGFLDPQFVPSFSRSLGGIIQTVKAGLLHGSLVISLWRSMTGLIAASLLAVPAGLFFGRSGLGECFNPLFRFLSLVNPFTLSPLFILFFGISEGAKAGIIGWVSFWPVFFNTLEGARDVDPVLIKTARGMAASGAAMFFTVILPGAASSIFAGLKLGLEMSFFVLIAVEMIGASSGLGWLVQASYWNMRFEWMYGAMTAAIALGFCMSAYLDRLRDKMFFWREEPAGRRGRAQPDSRRLHSRRPYSRRPFGRKDLIAAALLVLLIYLAGLRQIGETQKEWQRFGKEGYTAPGIGIFDE